jgi:hypothetical protein
MQTTMDNVRNLEILKSLANLTVQAAHHEREIDRLQKRLDEADRKRWNRMMVINWTLICLLPILSLCAVLALSRP